MGLRATLPDMTEWRHPGLTLPESRNHWDAGMYHQVGGSCVGWGSGSTFSELTSQPLLLHPDTIASPTLALLNQKHPMEYKDSGCHENDIKSSS